VADYWAQEDTRSHPSAGNIDAVIASSQLFGPVIFELIKPIVDGMVGQQQEASMGLVDPQITRVVWQYPTRYSQMLVHLYRVPDQWQGSTKIPRSVPFLDPDWIGCRLCQWIFVRLYVTGAGGG
jgi:hypothetical protein